MYDGKPYEWAYMVEHPFAADNAILKMNVEKPREENNLKFKPADRGSQVV